MQRSLIQVGIHRGVRARHAAFTTVELLMVIGIIIVLVAVLIPTLGHMKEKGRQTSTQTLLNALGRGIDAYYSTFEAYPGPLSSAYTAGDSSSSITKSLSGSQNMLLGLSYGLSITNTLPGPPNDVVQVPNTTSSSGPPPYCWYDPTKPTGPINNGQQLSAFFTVRTIQMTAGSGTPPTWPAGGIGGAANAKLAFPVVIDTFQDPLPVLYYRRTPGVEISSINASKLAAAAPAAGSSPATIAPYYLNENSEYTSGTLVSPSGTTIDETTSSMASSTFGLDDIGGWVRSSSGGVAHGGYLLVSAGSDRFYGRAAAPGGGYKAASDDIVVVGGN
jgi:type II secretory pathway pseudopilin PulG